MKRALVTGCTGQDGYWLTALLLQKGYEVHGFCRRNSKLPHAGIRPHYGDLMDPAAIWLAVGACSHDEIYHLGAQSHVGASFTNPRYTTEVTGYSTLHLLDAVKQHAPHARVYQAGSSEMFGNAPFTERQDENTPFQPASPYAVAKVFAHHTACLARKADGLFVANGILFNHESTQRGEHFVTRKISRAVGRIVHGLQDSLELGNLDARRDWGHAPEYVEAMWRMLQVDTPDDYVIATGETHTVREFAQAAFEYVGLDWTKYVRTDDAFRRPAEVNVLCGNAAKAEKLLGWKARIRFKNLVSIMVEHDLRLAERERG